MKKSMIIMASIFFLIAMPMVLAVQIDSGTYLNSTGLNLSINFTATMFADEFTVDSAYIEFVGFRDSDGSTEEVSFNVTDVNTSYFGSDMPYFSASTDEEKTVSSGVTDTGEATIYLDVNNCDNIGNIIYSSASNTYSTTYQSGDYTCASNIVTLTLDGIESGSNTFEIQYGCSATTRTGYRLVMILAAVALVAVVAMFVWRRWEEGEFTIGHLIALFMSIIVGVILWLASGQNLGASCGAVG